MSSSKAFQTEAKKLTQQVNVKHSIFTIQKIEDTIHNYIKLSQHLKSAS